MIGLDAGVAKLATLSDGTVFEPVNSFQKKPEDAGETSATVKPQGQIQQQLAEAETQKYSDCIPVSQISAGTTFTKSQRPSAKNHAMIVIEDLKVSNMSKSAAGTVSLPGRNVRAKIRFKPFDTGSGLV